MVRARRGEALSGEEEQLTDAGRLRVLRVFVDGSGPYRLIFIAHGRRAWLALRAVDNDQDRLPRSEIALAQKRLEDWRARGNALPEPGTQGRGTC